jgi:hypothetical protein
MPTASWHRGDLHRGVRLRYAVRFPPAFESGWTTDFDLSLPRQPNAVSDRVRRVLVNQVGRAEAEALKLL